MPRTSGCPLDRRGRLVSIATEHERTLFFDFLPVELGQQVNGFTTRFHLYTVPGQVYYRRSRRAVLQGVDGIVFVADSQPASRAGQPRLARRHRRACSSTIGLHARSSAAPAARVPVQQARSCAAALPVERMRRALNPGGLPDVRGGRAAKGAACAETLRTICKAVLGAPRRAAGASRVAPACWRPRRAPVRTWRARPRR